jgi:hypothetical protein
MNVRLVVLAVAGALCACGSSGGTGGPAPAGSAPPEITSVTANLPVVRPGDTVRITALVKTGSAGIDSAQLLRGTVELGTFVWTNAADSSVSQKWQADTTFTQLIDPSLKGLQNATVSQKITIRFTDNAGSRAEQTLDVPLGCGFDSESICKGSCLDTRTDNANCGGCGLTCGLTATGQAPQVTACRTGQCGTPRASSTTRESCDSVCAKYQHSGKPMVCTAVCSYMGSTDNTPYFGNWNEAGQTVYTGSSLTTALPSCASVPPANNPNFANDPFTKVNCCCKAQL